MRVFYIYIDDQHAYRWRIIISFWNFDEFTYTKFNHRKSNIHLFIIIKDSAIFLVYPSISRSLRLRILRKLQSPPTNAFEIFPRVSNSLGAHVLAISPPQGPSFQRIFAISQFVRSSTPYSFFACLPFPDRSWKISNSCIIRKDLLFRSDEVSQRTGNVS